MSNTAPRLITLIMLLQRHVDAPELEMYGSTFDPGNPASEFEICLPIERPG